jgi:hypothetical protein
VNQAEQQLFRTGAAAASFLLGMKSSLIEAGKILGPDAAAFIDRIEAGLVLGIKNLEPSPNIPDEVMQASVAYVLSEAANAFADVRRTLGIVPRSETSEES